jgi:hypothetical protein
MQWKQRYVAGFQKNRRGKALLTGFEHLWPKPEEEFAPVVPKAPTRRHKAFNYSFHFNFPLLAWLSCRGKVLLPSGRNTTKLKSTFTHVTRQAIFVSDEAAKSAKKKYYIDRQDKQDF